MELKLKIQKKKIQESLLDKIIDLIVRNKDSLKKGLISTGCFVEDIGLSLSPMVYFAQFNLEADAVAMVTASHNENGWTGVKMGIQKGLTHAPEEMKELKELH